MIAEAPTNRKMRSLSPMPHRPAIRSNDQIYRAPGMRATRSTAVASNEVGMCSRYAADPTVDATGAQDPRAGAHAGPAESHPPVRVA